MDPPEALRPQTDAEGSPSGGGPPAKTSSVLRVLPAVPTVPDYDLLRRIGGGAYGEVWLARSVATGALRAAKIVWRHTFQDERPFRREFEGIQHFEQISREHPSQLSLFHIGRNEAEGYFYYVMELADDAGEGQTAEGTRQNEGSARSASTVSTSNLHPSTFERYIPHTLRAELERGRLPASRVLEIGLALAEALSHLHRNGLVHRDVKPSNVIFVKGRPKLADIGLVTDASDQCSIVGTEGYLPPEGPGTPQGDIFALGKVLYEAATGMDRREFPKLPEDLRDWPDARLVFELNEIVLRACSNDTVNRYKSAQEVLDDLAHLGQGKSVRQKRTRQQLWAVGRKAGIGVAAVGALAAIVAILSRGVSTSAPSTDGPPSTNEAATAICAKGMLIIRGDNYPQFAEAYTNFHQAIELDPRFARPYVGLLELRVREGIPALGPMSSEELRSIARKLSELATNSAAAYCAQSIVSFYDWDFPRAEEFSLRAIKADPNYELGHTAYGYALLNWGRPAEARTQLNISRRLAPSKVTVYRMLAHTYFAERDFTNAIAWYQKTLGWESHHVIAYQCIGDSYVALGDYTNAIYNYRAEAFFYTTNELATRSHFDDLLRVLHDGGPRAYWENQWSNTKDHPNSDFYWKAIIRIHLGDTNGALTWLNRSYETREHDGRSYETLLIYLLFHDCWDGSRQNPQFQQLLDKVGFTKVMPSEKR